MTPLAGELTGLVRSALDGLVPYEPGKPVETVQRELGLSRVVKLASNEGPFGPFPEALEAIDRVLPDANRYPDGGCYVLREALAERHGVGFDEVVVAAGADAVIGYVCQATLDPGDEVVTPWPSFPSYVLDPLKLAAATVRVELSDGRIDVDALLAAVTERTKLAFLPTVNNPTGTAITSDELRRFVDGRPRARPDRRRRGVLRVRRRPVVPGRDRGGRRRRAPACWRCGRSRRSTASRACGSATASARRR